MNCELRITKNFPVELRAASSGRFLSFVILFFILHSSCFIHSARAQGNVGIGITTPDASALLDLTSVSRGLLVPRMTHDQRDQINFPAIGLLVFCTDSISSLSPSTFYFYDGSDWVPFLATGWSLWSVLGNYGTTPSNNFVGTNDSEDFVMRTDNLERLRIFANGNVGLTNTNDTAEELRLYEPSDSGTYYTGFKAGTQSGNVTYTLPTSDGFSSQVLATNGSGHLFWRTINSLWARGAGTGSLVGLGSGNTAAGDYGIAAGRSNSATGIYSAAFGYEDVASGIASDVSGGSTDTASGDYSDVGGGQFNVASGSYSSIGGGQHNTASGSYSVVVGGSSNTASGSYSTIVGGSGNIASGSYSMVFGQNAIDTESNSIVFYGSGEHVGIGISSPSQALDINGSLKFSGALMPNGNAGTSGYVLVSNGAGSPPVWTSPTSPANLFWSTFGNTGTSSSINYLGTTDTQAFVIKTDGNEAMRILSNGKVGIGTIAPTNQLQSVYSGTRDETAAVLGNATAATSNQAIGVWGAASNVLSTGTIGVLATGNGNLSAGQTNAALQLNDGEFAMGRTTETDAGFSPVEPAASGSAYSAEGPSGVIELTLGPGGNLNTIPPVTDSFQNLGTLTINNQYCAATSIVIVNVLEKINNGAGLTPDCTQAEYFVDVDNRQQGSFDIRVGMIPLQTSSLNYSPSDMIKIGYVIINPGR